MKNLLSPGTVSRFYALLTLMLIALLLIMTGEANAATYYVSPDGDNDNAGTDAGGSIRHGRIADEIGAPADRI